MPNASYANRVKINHQAIDDNRVFPDFGDAKINVLWPKHGVFPSDDENDNSIVFTITQNDYACVLTGDAEEKVWNSIKNKIPANTVFFKVPHHGSGNGLDHTGKGTWITNCPQTALLGISTHNRPYKHPHQEVLDEFSNKGFSCVRTDNNYHLELNIDANGLRSKYSK